MAIYFAKDVLAAVVYLSFFVAYRRKEVTSFRPPFLVPLLLFVWLGVMQVFNPASTTFIYGLLGLKIYFYYIPFLFVGYAFLNSEAELRRFFFVNMVLALIIVSLGIVQSILGHTFLNPAVIAEDIRELSTLYRAAPISGAISYRPTSVFVSTGRFANFLLVIWLLVFGFSWYLLLRHKRGRALAFLVFGLTAAAIALCQGRSCREWRFTPKPSRPVAAPANSSTAHGITRFGISSLRSVMSAGRTDMALAHCLLALSMSRVSSMPSRLP
jgi:hypothetical protein